MRWLVCLVFRWVDLRLVGGLVLGDVLVLLIVLLWVGWIVVLGLVL